MFNTVITMINACKDDADFEIREDTIYLTIDDFVGFDENWNEIMRDYDHPEEVDTLLDWLDNNSIPVTDDLYTDDLYTDYSFNGFTVRLGFTSFDI